MTINQVKEEAKKRFDKDLTDEQAQAWLEAHPAGELQDEELADVAGGGCGGGGTSESPTITGYGLCPDFVCSRCSSSKVDKTLDGHPAHVCVGRPGRPHDAYNCCLNCKYKRLNEMKCDKALLM